MGNSRGLQDFKYWSDIDMFMPYCDPSFSCKDCDLKRECEIFEENDEDIEDFKEDEGLKFTLDLIQAKNRNLELELEEKNYIISALIDKIKTLECMVWELEN